MCSLWANLTIDIPMDYPYWGSHASEKGHVFFIMYWSVPVKIELSNCAYISITHVLKSLMLLINIMRSLCDAISGIGAIFLL